MNSEHALCTRLSILFVKYIKRSMINVEPITLYYLTTVLILVPKTFVSYSTCAEEPVKNQ